MSKGKIQEAFLHWDYSEPWGFSSPQKWGEGQCKGPTPRSGLMIRKSWTYHNTWQKNHQDTYAKGDPWTCPTVQKNKLHPLHEPPQNLEKLKLRVTFLVTEIKAKYPEQTMKQPEWVKWNVGQRPKPKNQTNEQWWLRKTKLSWITEESVDI